jgi:hypothetical protein
MKRALWTVALIACAQALPTVARADNEYSEVAYSTGGSGSGGAMAGGGNRILTQSNQLETVSQTTTVSGIGQGILTYDGTSNSTVSVSASAGPGVLRVDAVGASTASSTSADTFVQDAVSSNMIFSASAEFADNVVMSKSGLNGTPLEVHGSFVIEGGMAVNAAPAEDAGDTRKAQIGMQLFLKSTAITTSLPTSSGMSVASASADSTGVEITSSIPEIVPVTFELVSGEDYLLDNTLFLEGNASASESGGTIGYDSNGSAIPAPPASDSVFYSANYAHSVLWGGISSVTLPDGTPVTGWTITSDSGFDYTQPAVDPDDVPEPASLGLLACAPVVKLRRRPTRPMVNISLSKRFQEPLFS